MILHFQILYEFSDSIMEMMHLNVFLLIYKVLHDRIF